MPRKTPASAARPAGPRGFNEAAARCRGKPMQALAARAIEAQLQ